MVSLFKKAVGEKIVSCVTQLLSQPCSFILKKSFISAEIVANKSHPLQMVSLVVTDKSLD